MHCTAYCGKQVNKWIVSSSYLWSWYVDYWLLFIALPNMVRYYVSGLQIYSLWSSTVLWSLSSVVQLWLQHQNVGMFLTVPKFYHLFTNQLNYFPSALLLMVLHWGTTFLMRCMYPPRYGILGGSSSDIFSIRHTHLCLAVAMVLNQDCPWIFTFYTGCGLMHLSVCLNGGD